MNRLQLNGVDQIAGQATPIDITYGPGNTTADLTTGGTFVPTAALSDYAGSNPADLAIRLATGNASVAQAYGTIRDAYVYSNSTVTLQAGDSLSFEWKALSAVDAYDAYGYIIDVNTGHTVTILDSTGTTYNQETAWATVTHTIASGEEGTYRFVFVAGSYDLTGGRYLGAALMIDDVSVSQANPAAVGDSVIQALARAVTYRYADIGDSLAGSTRTVTMTVVDGASTTFSDTGAITIASANHPPSITSGATAGFAENAAGTVYIATGTDPDPATTLTYALGGVDAGLFNINAASGVVTFRTSPDFEAPADAGGNNFYDITVTASDGSLSSAARAVSITVRDVNETPWITSAAATSFAENGTTYVYNAFGSDPDRDTLTYTLGGADAALFNINAATGAVTFKTAPDFETPRDNGANNIYDITVTASDGSLSSAAQAVAITITDVLEYWVRQGNSVFTNITAEFYSGPLQWLRGQLQYVGIQAPDMRGNDIVIGTMIADLINSGAGDDAIDGGAGNDVLDGGTGSNFLTGGAGVDNFFVDGRAAATAITWSTIADFTAGEHVTIWGNQPGVSKFVWVASDGVFGYKGATLHCDLDGNGTTDTSVTFAGLTQAQLPTQTYGTVQGVDYVFIG